MCYRFFLKAQDLQKAARKLRALCVVDYKTRHNIAPGGPVPVVRPKGSSERETKLLRWGLVPSWSQGPAAVGIKMANARAETLAEKPSFKKAFQERRCVLPASGFFEWETAAGGEKLPWLFSRRDGEPLLLAGLWEEWIDGDGRALESCSIVTTQPNQLLARIHDRMPVILDEVGAERWLSRETNEAGRLNELCIPFPTEALREEAVDTWVNKVGNDDERCLSPRRPEPRNPASEQLGLGF